jgi:hypothetical protein
MTPEKKLEIEQEQLLREQRTYQTKLTDIARRLEAVRSRIRRLALEKLVGRPDGVRCQPWFRGHGEFLNGQTVTLLEVRSTRASILHGEKTYSVPINHLIPASELVGTTLQIRW